MLEGFRIYDVLPRMAVEQGDDTIGCHETHAPEGRLTGAPDVGGDRDIVQGEQWVIHRDRFRVGYINGRPA